METDKLEYKICMCGHPEHVCKKIICDINEINK